MEYITPPIATSYVTHLPLLLFKIRRLVWIAHGSEPSSGHHSVSLRNGFGLELVSFDTFFLLAKNYATILTQYSMIDIHLDLHLSACMEMTMCH